MTHDTAPSDNPRPTSTTETELPPCPGRRAALGCALAFGIATVLAESAEAATAKYYSAGTAKSYGLNKPKLVKFLGGQAAVYVTKVSATGWRCLWAGCTHESCLVSWQTNHSQYYCPCHGARFSSTGKVLAGPTQQALYKLPVKVIKAKVMVDLAPTGLV